jgi:hypothetical protein
MSFDGTTFKGIDDDMVLDYASQNTLQDHILRNAEYWEHKTGGARLTSGMYSSSNLASAGSGDNDLIMASYKKASVWKAPFLVKPGLKEITLYMWGTVSNVSATAPYDVYMSLQVLGADLDGRGSSPVSVWTGDATETPDLYSITYTFPDVIRAEYESDLILWMSCSPVSTADQGINQIAARDNRWHNGKTPSDVFNQFTSFGDPGARSHILRVAGNTVDAESLDIVDVQRTFSGSTVSGGYDIAFTVQSDRFYPELEIYQDFVNYIAPRSFFIEETRDEL